MDDIKDQTGRELVSTTKKDDTKNVRSEQSTTEFTQMDPFARSETIQRTPPRPRAASLTNLELNDQEKRKLRQLEGDEIQQQIKRKRSDIYKFFLPENLKGVTASSTGEDLRRTIERTCLLIKDLEKIVIGAYKPKKELQDISTKLLLECAKLQSAKYGNWLDKAIDESAEPDWKDEKETLCSENKILRQKLEEAERRQHEMVEESSVAQCNECKKILRKNRRRKELTTKRSFEYFAQVSEQDWEDEIFPRVALLEGQIWDAPGDWDLVLPCNTSLQPSTRWIARAVERFGSKDGLQKQNKKKGQVAMMAQSLSFPDADGNFTGTSRHVYFPIVTDGSNLEEAEDKDIFECLMKIKEHIIKNKRNKLALPEMEGIVGTIMTRITEYLFSDLEVEVVMYRTKAIPEKEVKPAKPNRVAASKQTHAQPRPERPKKDAILVKMKDTTYADLLKIVKTSVNPREMGVQVDGIKKTKNGELLLTVRNGYDKAEVLKKELRERVPMASASHLVRSKTIHIKDMDDVTTAEEVKLAVAKALSVKPDSFEVRALRPAFGQRQNVTIKIGEHEGDKLMQMGKIKIGWLECRIMERKQEVKCYRCWQLGHVKAQCTGIDRENNCLKCSQEGHKAFECPNNPYCVQCEQEGHQTGNAKCAGKGRASNSGVPAKQ